MSPAGAAPVSVRNNGHSDRKSSEPSCKAQPIPRYLASPTKPARSEWTPGIVSEEAIDFGVEIGGGPDFEILPGDCGLDTLKAKKRCANCRDHRALFKYKGRIHFERHHNLCLRCFRSLIDSIRNKPSRSSQFSPRNASSIK